MMAVGSLSILPRNSRLPDGDLERRLSQTMREDLVALARTGELPWDRYDRARRATRIYDIHPRIAFDPAAPERRIWDGAQL